MASASSLVLAPEMLLGASRGADEERRRTLVMSKLNTQFSSCATAPVHDAAEWQEAVDWQASM